MPIYRYSAACTLLGLSACFSPTETASLGTNSSGPTLTSDSSETDPNPTSAQAATTSEMTSDTMSATDTTGGDLCGDGTVHVSEVCDDGINDGAYGGCAPECDAFAEYCGDGQINGPENCDDDDDINGNGCNNDCGISAAVIWTIQGGEGEQCTGHPRRVRVDSDNNIYVAGAMQCSGMPSRSWLGKYQGDGRLTWSTTWGTGGSFLLGMSVRNADLVAVGVEENQAYSRRYDLNGVLIEGGFHDAKVGESVVFFGTSILDGAFVSAGYIQPAVGPRTLLLQSVDWTGKTLWTAPAEPAVLVDVAASPNGTGFALAGAATGGSEADMLIRLYTSEGTQLWTQTVAGSGGLNDSAEGVAIDLAGNIIVVGRIREDTQKFWVRNFAPDGNWRWTHTSDESPGPDVLLKVAVDSSGAVVIVGSAEADADAIGQAWNIWLRKLSPTGLVLWTQTHNGDADLGDALTDVAIDSNDNIIVVGSVRDTPESEFWMRKYAP